MVKTINMQDIRYLNLFSRVSRVNTKFCFMYNNTLIFCVPKKLIYRAIGRDGKNVKRLSEILKKRIKILSTPQGIADAEEFIKNIVDPVTFREFEVNENEIIITAGKTNKAALIGREKRRLIEMQKIVKDFFDRDLKIV